jgi:hypothetical protein
MFHLLNLNASQAQYNYLLATQNNYPMREWHLENMHKTVIKYVTGLSGNATLFQKRLHKKYSGNLGYVTRSIGFDIKHGVAKEEVITFFDKVKSDPEFSKLVDSSESEERLNSLEKYIAAGFKA